MTMNESSQPCEQRRIPFNDEGQRVQVARPDLPAPHYICMYRLLPNTPPSRLGIITPTYCRYNFTDHERMDIRYPIFNSVSNICYPIFNSVSNIRFPIFNSVSNIRYPIFNSVSNIRYPIFNSVSNIRYPIFNSVFNIRYLIFNSVSTPIPNARRCCFRWESQRLVTFFMRHPSSSSVEVYLHPRPERRLSVSQRRTHASLLPPLHLVNSIPGRHMALCRRYRI